MKKSEIVDLEITDTLQSAAQIAHELKFKGTAVESLEDKLTALGATIERVKLPDEVPAQA